MIGNKEKFHAAKIYAKEQDLSIESYIGDIIDCTPQLEDAFISGANWLKSNLWHSTDEVPKRLEPILVEQDLSDNGKLSYDTDVIISTIIWNNIVKNENITRWCYISDII